MALVLLVYPAPDEFKTRRFGFSLDLLYTAAILKQARHQAVYADYSIENYSPDSFYRLMDIADAVIFEWDSFTLKRSVNAGNGIRLLRDMTKRYGTGRNREKRIILTGNDFFVSGEPRAHDGSLMEYDAILPTGCLLQAPTVLENIMRRHPSPPLQSPDTPDLLPFPDRSLLSAFIEHGGAADRKPDLAKSTLLRTSAGCPNTCVFCQRKAWSKGLQSHSVRYVLEEFSLLKEAQYRNIWIADDNFAYDLKRAKQILTALAAQNLTEGMRIALSSWTRIDEPFLDLAKAAYVSIISFGIESANPEIQKFYRKQIPLEPFRRLVHYANKIGIFTVGNFILGAPMESRESIEETFDYIMKTPFDQVNIKILDYMAGSDLWNHLPMDKRTLERHMFACRENGLNNFPLAELRAYINKFTTQFRHENAASLKLKIQRYGPPYLLLKNDQQSPPG